MPLTHYQINPLSHIKASACLDQTWPLQGWLEDIKQDTIGDSPVQDLRDAMRASRPYDLSSIRRTTLPICIGNVVCPWFRADVHYRTHIYLLSQDEHG